MAFIVPTAWSNTATYVSGNQVLRDGVLYEATTAIAAGVDPKTSNDWKVIAVHEIQDYNSLIEAIRLNLNVSENTDINRSIPLFIQLAEESFKTRIRVPQQRKRAILTVDSSGRIAAPGDLLEVINLRENSDAPSGSGTDIRARGVIEILNGNYEEYQKLLRFENSNNNVDSSDIFAFDAPVYWFDSQYFNIAPLYSAGTQMELWYYSLIPQLGSTVMVNNAPVTITQNWFTAAAPQMLLYGALTKAEGFLHDDARMEIWKQKFEEAQIETQDMINRFENDQPHAIYIENTYSSNI